MANILTATEIEESVEWIMRIVRGSNPSENTEVAISDLLADRDRLLSRKVEEIEEENEEVENFWETIRMG